MLARCAPVLLLRRCGLLPDSGNGCALSVKRAR